MNPDTYVKRSIAELLPPGELLYTCRIAPDFYEVCNDPALWKSKLMKDYYINIIFADPLEYRQLYELIYQGVAKVFRIHINGKFIGSSYILPTQQLTLLMALTAFLEDRNLHGNVGILNNVRATDTRGTLQALDSPFITHVYL